MPSDTNRLIDARLAVILSALEPGLTLARVSNLSLDDLRELLDIGYTRQLQKRGMSWENISRRLGKSRRTVASLAKRAASSVPLLAQSKNLEWQRTIISRLQGGPLPKDELAPRVTSEREPFDRALVDLLEDGTLQEEDGGLLSIAAPFVDLLGDTFDSRLDSLRHYLDATAHVVYRRFLSPAPESKAFARVLSFSVLPGQLEELLADYNRLEEKVIAMDGEADGSPDAVPAALTFAFVEVPTGPGWKSR